MEPTADTVEAPAVSSLEEALDSGFLPTDPHYRLTGKFKDETPSSEKEIHEDPSEKDSATPGDKGEDADNAAAPAAATTEEQEKEQQRDKTTRGKTSAKSDRDWKKLSEKYGAAQREIDELKRQLSGKSETKTEPQPVAEKKADGNPRPKLDDVDPKTGKPKYSTYAEFENAKDEWNRKEAIREFQESSQKTERERAQSQAKERIQQEVNQRVAKAKKDYADYDEVVASGVAAKDAQGRDAIFIPEGSAADLFILDSDRGQDVLYHVLKDIDQHGHIFARDAQGNFLLSPVRQVRELAKIEASLAAPAAAARSNEAPRPKITQAPRPPVQTSGQGGVSKDAVVQAAEDGDFETYQREQNARDLARRKKAK